MTGSYRYTGTTWYREGDVVTLGDVVSPTDAELDAFGDVLEPVGDGGEDADEGDAVDTPDAPPEPYECGAELASDGECSRSVDGPDERCFDHRED